MLNSKDARNAWCAIAEAIINMTVDKCIRKIRYLVDAYKEKKEWNGNQTAATCENLFSTTISMLF